MSEHQQTWWWIFWECLIGARNPAGARHWATQKLILQGWLKPEQTCPRRSEGPGFRGVNQDWWRSDQWGRRWFRKSVYWLHNGPASKLARSISDWGWETARQRDFDWFGRRARWIGQTFNWYSGGTRWEWPWQPRACSYCGGGHPDDIIRLLREGWEIEGTTKPYKRYVAPPRIGVRALSGPYCDDHKGQPIKLPVRAWSPVPPVKLYTPHFSEEQIKIANDLISKLPPEITC